MSLHSLWRGLSLCWLQGAVLCCAVLRGARAGTDGVGCSPEWVKAGKGGKNVAVKTVEDAYVNGEFNAKAITEGETLSIV